MKRIAFYGGSFDPPHNGHLAIAERLTKAFALNEFVFVPAHHAPHKRRRKPTSPFHRHAMLCLATNRLPKVSVSRLELENPNRPYSIETLRTFRRKLPGSVLFFVIGADSWAEITTWRDWEKVVTLVNIIVVSRPGFEIGTSHITGRVRRRITDLRGRKGPFGNAGAVASRECGVYFTDVVNIDVSATEVRRRIAAGERGWSELLQNDVAKYVEKYEIYK